MGGKKFSTKFVSNICGKENGSHSITFSVILSAEYEDDGREQKRR